MKQITALTQDANQQVTLVLDDGSKVSMGMIYVPSQNGWFYTLSYGNLWPSTNPLSMQRLINNPNILRKYRNLIPFGICCIVIDGYEPIYQSDFVSGRVNLYLLNQIDVAQTETLITLTLPNFVGYPLN